MSKNAIRAKVIAVTYWIISPYSGLQKVACDFRNYCLTTIFLDNTRSDNLQFYLVEKLGDNSVILTREKLRKLRARRDRFFVLKYYLKYHLIKRIS